MTERWHHLFGSLCVSWRPFNVYICIGSQPILLRDPRDA